jgi:hypothetical protein
VVAKESSKPPVKSAAAYKATVVHEAQTPPRDAAQAPTMAAPPIDPNLGAMPSMTLEHVERIGSQSATHDSVKLTPAQLAILDGPPRRADAPTQPPPSNPLPPGVQEGSYNESPYPVVSGRPFSTDIAPSARPSHANVPRTGPQQPNGQQAANLMSPVGEHYPQHDWDAAAAAPARALTRIQLGLLFVAVVAGAITLTMIVAKIIH